MLQRGDIVLERLTGKRAIVIAVVDAGEVTCRFADGRFDNRYTFELEPVVSFLNSLLSFVTALLGGGPRERSSPSVTDRVRPLLARRS